MKVRDAGLDGAVDNRRKRPGAQSRENLRRRDHMATHKVVKHDEWLRARKRHLAKEKEFTRMRDQLSRERRDLPWELVEKQYTFESERGTQTLSDVFAGRGQLVIYHAMFNPDTAGLIRPGRPTRRASSAPSGWTTSTASPST